VAGSGRRRPVSGRASVAGGGERAACKWRRVKSSNASTVNHAGREGNKTASANFYCTFYDMKLTSLFLYWIAYNLIVHHRLALIYCRLNVKYNLCVLRHWRS
jgi:hypothetical protein